MRDVQIAARFAVAGHAAAALLHAIWLVSPWPLADWPAWSRAFGGPHFRVPWTVMTAVAALFAFAAYMVGAHAGLFRTRLSPRLVHAAVVAIALILTTRAILGWVQMSSMLSDPRMTEGFRQTTMNYLRIYLPVFAALGLSSGYVALRKTARP